jgi:hypothetical protein
MQVKLVSVEEEEENLSILDNSLRRRRRGVRSRIVEECASAARKH